MGEAPNERGEAIERMWKSLMAIEAETGMGREVLEWMLLRIDPEHDYTKWCDAFRDACMEWDV